MLKHSSRHWFEPLADHLGPAYLRYSFTKGTRNEVDFLVEALGLEPGQRVLDVGCGPGRHAHELARRGLTVVGVDIAAAFVRHARADAPSGAHFVRADARRLPVRAGFDVVLSACQGAFGLQGGPAAAAQPVDAGDEAILAGAASALRPGGRLVLTAFSAYFAARHLEEGEQFDAATGGVTERTFVKDLDGVSLDAELWTTCYTPRELRLAAAFASLEPEHIWSVSPGNWTRRPPDVENPEFLMIARRR